MFGYLLQIPLKSQEYTEWRFVSEDGIGCSTVARMSSMKVEDSSLSASESIFKLSKDSVCLRLSKYSSVEIETDCRREKKTDAVSIMSSISIETTLEKKTTLITTLQPYKLLAKHWDA
ncbi:unnamed protein product [Larinioides sclopetarius]|uniref:Uncharacterized protein n=1 Tax=Larinioides sclopetarius TaxID=280406 RepID=A0AAV2AVD1_9ARAC